MAFRIEKDIYVVPPSVLEQSRKLPTSVVNSSIANEDVSTQILQDFATKLTYAEFAPFADPWARLLGRKEIPKKSQI